MSKHPPLVAALVACLALSRPALAQEAVTDLTSQGAVEIAVKNNPSLHIALLQQQQALYAVQAEEALYVPVFNANASYAHNGSPTLRGTDGTIVSVSDIALLGAGLSKTFSTGTTVGAERHRPKPEDPLAADRQSRWSDRDRPGLFVVRHGDAVAAVLARRLEHRGLGQRARGAAQPHRCHACRARRRAVRFCTTC